MRRLKRMLWITMFLLQVGNYRITIIPCNGAEHLIMKKGVISAEATPFLMLL